MTQISKRYRDMSYMLPRFYSEAPEVEGVLYPEAIEIESVRHKARELLAQISATTATWGLSDWERVLDLPPRPNSSDELRRARILAKLRGTAPATLANMLTVVNAHTASKDARIIELPEPGTVLFEINANAPFDLRGLAEDIATYIPAHLAYRIATATHANAYMATLMQSGISVTVYPYRPEPITQQAQVSHGGSMINAQTTTIYPKGDD